MAVILCRHGSTDANVDARFLSRTDMPLNEAGRAQCARLREALEGFGIAQCFVSPMRRCLETAALAAADVPRIVCDELKEIDFGLWECATAAEIRRAYPEDFERRLRDPVRFRPPHGESFSDVAGRLAPLARRMRSQSRDVLIVAHRGTLAVLERLLRALPLDDRSVAALEPGSFRRLEPVAGILPATFPNE